MNILHCFPGEKEVSESYTEGKIYYDTDIYMNNNILNLFTDRKETCVSFQPLCLPGKSNCGISTFFIHEIFGIPCANGYCHLKFTKCFP